MASGTGTVSAFQVGSYFVGQYYHVLQKQPELAHKFYSDVSEMVQIDGDLTENASSMPQIHTLLMNVNFAGIEIKTINSLDSWKGGLMVMVTGTVKSKNFSGRRKFVQSFFLAPQDNGFFVLNDIFKFNDEEVIYQQPQPEVIYYQQPEAIYNEQPKATYHEQSEAIYQEQSPIYSENNFDSQQNAANNRPELSVSDYGLEEESIEYNNYSQVEDNSVDKYHLSEQQQYQEPVVETIPEETYSPIQSATNAVQHNHSAALEEPVVVQPPVKKTWASLLSGAKGQSGSSFASQPTQRTHTPPASDWNYVPQVVPQPPKAEVVYTPEFGVEAAVGSLSLEDEGEPKSVYVRNLPSYITSAELEQEFEKFGEIKPDGIFIKNKEEFGFCFAFVEFHDLSAVQNAIKASPIQLAGRPVYIEERRANPSSASRGRGRGRGRGTYQTESTRGGRGGGRGYQQRGSQGY